LHPITQTPGTTVPPAAQGTTGQAPAPLQAPPAATITAATITAAPPAVTTTITAAPPAVTTTGTAAPVATTTGTAAPAQAADGQAADGPTADGQAAPAQAADGPAGTTGPAAAPPATTGQLPAADGEPVPEEEGPKAPVPEPVPKGEPEGEGPKGEPEGEGPKLLPEGEPGKKTGPEEAPLPGQGPAEDAQAEEGQEVEAAKAAKAVEAAGEMNGGGIDDPIYKLFSSILLFISNLLLCVGTLLFINAFINLHKATFDIADKNRQISIEQPIFEYLKSNNFMYVDKFLLEAPNSPVFIIFICIICISLAFICLFSAYLYHFEGKAVFSKFYESNKPNPWWKLLKYLPYLYILILISIFNGILRNNTKDLSDLKREYDAKIIDFNTSEYYKFDNSVNKSGSNFLKELKSIIIQNIYNNTIYNDTTQNIIINQLAQKLGENKEKVKAIFGSDGTANTIKIVNAIYTIYHLDYKYEEKTDKIEDDKAKAKRQKYIEYIDFYFNLLINDADIYYNQKKKKERPTNYYAMFYLIGLIKNSETLKDDEKNTRDAVWNKEGPILNGLSTDLNIKLQNIKNSVFGYYVSTIFFYFILLSILFGYYFDFNIYKMGISFMNLLLMYKINLRSLFIILIMILAFIILSIYTIVYLTK
jgi:hypothetical protein